MVLTLGFAGVGDVVLCFGDDGHLYLNPGDELLFWGEGLGYQRHVVRVRKSPAKSAAPGRVVRGGCRAARVLQCPWSQQRDPGSRTAPQ